MVRLFGTNWINSHGLDDRNGECLHFFRNLTSEQLDYGIERISNSGKEWPPSLPEIKKLCKPIPEAMGFPSLAAAWKEANEYAHQPDHHPWSHRAVYLAGRFTKWFNIRQANTLQEQREVKHRFACEYQGLVDQVAQGKSLEPIRMIESQFDPKAAADQGVQEVMQKQGIDPKGGRAEFKKGLKGLIG